MSGQTQRQATLRQSLDVLVGAVQSLARLILAIVKWITISGAVLAWTAIWLDVAWINSTEGQLIGAFLSIVILVSTLAIVGWWTFDVETVVKRKVST